MGPFVWGQVCVLCVLACIGQVGCLSVRKVDWEKFLLDHAGFELENYDPRVDGIVFHGLSEQIVSQRSSQNQQERVEIVGGGPVGLLSAVICYLSGFRDVVVFEKRLSYDRDIWFDYYGEPWSSGLKFLDHLGLHEVGKVDVDWIGHMKGRLHTVRCKSLERFLALVVQSLGMKIRFGQEKVEPSKEHSTITIDASGTKSMLVPTFCDGPIHRSPPQELKWETSSLTRAVPPQKILTQWTWLGSLSTCDIPEFPQGDPFFASTKAELAGVTAIFQRFFGNVCEVQVLFRDAERNRERAVKRAFQSFQGEILKHELFNISINMLSFPGCVLANTNNLLLSLGDSGLNSYYRIGIGLHKAFAELRFLASILDNSQDPLPQLENLQQEREKWASFATTVLFLETYCDNIFLGFDINVDEGMIASASIHHRDANHNYNRIFWDSPILDHCHENFLNQCPTDGV